MHEITTILGCNEDNDDNLRKYTQLKYVFFICFNLYKTNFDDLDVQPPRELRVFILVVY